VSVDAYDYDHAIPFDQFSWNKASRGRFRGKQHQVDRLPE
jgi:hypothetical protein